MIPQRARVFHVILNVVAVAQGLDLPSAPACAPTAHAVSLVPITST